MMPGALLVVLVGIVVAIVQYPTVVRALRLGPSIHRIIVPRRPSGRQVPPVHMCMVMGGLAALEADLTQELC